MPITDPLLWGGGTTMWDKKVKIKDVLQKEGDSLSYEYDLGDSWKHTIVLEKIEDGGSKSVRCFDGARAAPHEDCGGIHGYQELIHHLRHPEKDGYIELLEWLDDDYDPENFDHDKRVAERVSEIQNKLKRNGRTDIDQIDIDEAIDEMDTEQQIEIDIAENTNPTDDYDDGNPWGDEEENRDEYD